jgi:hypothetical protein
MMSVVDTLKQPYTFACVTAVLAAVLTYAYMAVSQADAEASKKAAAKVLVVTLGANLLLTYLVHHSEPISTEAFET